MFGVSGTGFHGSGFRGRGCGGSRFQVMVFSLFGVFEVRGCGTGCTVRGFGFGVTFSGFRVRGFGSCISRFGVPRFRNSGTWFRGSWVLEVPGIEVPGLEVRRFEVRVFAATGSEILGWVFRCSGFEVRGF